MVIGVGSGGVGGLLPRYYIISVAVHKNRGNIVNHIVSTSNRSMGAFPPGWFGNMSPNFGVSSGEM